MLTPHQAGAKLGAEGKSGSGTAAAAALFDNGQLAMRLARRCREIVQSCLREEEWMDAEEEFRWIILAGLNEATPRNDRTF